MIPAGLCLILRHAFSTALFAVGAFGSLSSAFGNSLQCHRISTQFDDLKVLSSSLFSPNFHDSCSASSLSATCAKYKQKLEAGGENWKTYLAACEAPGLNSLYKYPLSCVSYLDGLIDGAQRTMQLEALKHQQDQFCSKESNNKRRLIEIFNSDVPAALSVDQKTTAQLVESRSCAEISSYLLRRIKNRSEQLNLRIGAKVRNGGVTSEEMDFLIWQSHLQNATSSEISWSQLKRTLELQVEEWPCMNSHRKIELTCQIIQSLAGGHFLIVRSGLLSPLMSKKPTSATSHRRTDLNDEISRQEKQYGLETIERLKRYIPAGTPVSLAYERALQRGVVLSVGDAGVTVRLVDGRVVTAPWYTQIGPTQREFQIFDRYGGDDPSQTTRTFGPPPTTIRGR